MLHLILMVALGEGPAWSPLTRDVYVDGAIVRGAVLWRGEEGSAVLALPETERLIVLFEENGAHLAARASGRGFTVAADSRRAHGTVTPVGEAVPVHEIEPRQQLFALAGHTVLISGHRNVPGPMEDEATIYESAPQWRVLRDHAKPARDAVRVLETIEGPLTLEVYFATWCGDSRRDVPLLLAALREAANPDIDLELISVGNGFTEPAEALAADRITNVPTIIASRNGEELGRIIERPTGESVIHDLAAILEGAYTITGEPEGPIIARGELVRRDQNGRLRAVERWQLSERRDGGLRLWSRIEGLEDAVEVLMSTDSAEIPSFIQVTRDGEDHRHRTRVTLRGNEISLTTRGSDTGVIKQRLGRGERLNAVTPSWIVNGWIAGRFPDSELSLSIDQRARLRKHEGWEEARAILVGVTRRHVVRQLRGSRARWDLLAGTGLPLAAEIGDELAEMTVLHLEPPQPTAAAVTTLSR